MSYLRKIVIDNGGYFIMADMTSVNNFWGILADQTLRSLDRPGVGGQNQTVSLAQKLAELAGVGDLKAPGDFFETAKAQDYAAVADKICAGLFKNRAWRANALDYQDLIRFLLLTRSDDLKILDEAKFWYSSDRDMEDSGNYGFKRNKKPSNEWFMIGLTWLVSIVGGFTVIGIDQLDSTVQINALSTESDEENQASRRILISVSDGFAALISNSHSCFTVATVLSDTWDNLNQKGLKPALERFDRQQTLSAVTKADTGKGIVLGRLSEGYEKVGFNPPYPTWPFPAKVFEGISFMPRELLQCVAGHFNRCLILKRVFECEGLTINRGPGPEPVAAGEFSAIEERFRYHRGHCDVGALKTAGSENGFWVEALAVLSEAFAGSISLSGDQEIVIGDDSRPLHKNYRSFTFLRHFYVNGGAADHCLSLWAILHDNARAFQARLSTSLDQSGIDKGLGVRRLAVIRFSPLPAGNVTATKIKEFTTNKGIWLEIPDGDLRLLYALFQVSKEFDGLFRQWVDYRKPAQAIGSIVPHLEWLIGWPPGSMKPTEEPGQPWPPDMEISGGEGLPPIGPDPDSPGGQGPGAPGGDTEPAQPKSDEALAAEPLAADPKGQAPREGGGGTVNQIRIGTIPYHDDIVRPLSLSSDQLLKHVAILGGTGSGKTVLLRRVIEEASLGGTSAVIMDVSGDLCCLGQRWGEPREVKWLFDDEQKAMGYFSRTETVIWTPKISRGNPLTLPIIPNLMAIRDDSDALEEAVALTIEGLSAIDGLKMMKDIKKRGLIAVLLRLMSTYTRERPLNLDDLINLLNDLPQQAYEACGDDVCKQGRSMATELQAAANLNLELKETDTTNVADLLVSPGGKARLSVVYLKGISSGKERESFVQKLMVNLFTWITKNTMTKERLSYLVVVDEAKDFIPSVASSPAKKAIMRFANQGRKFGCGLILASQGIRSLDNQTISNCKNLFVGYQGSPTDVETCKKMGLFDVNKLKTGEFMGRSESFTQFNKRQVKFKASMCLSRHPNPPPAQEEITKMAHEHRKRYGFLK
ncbi:MAG: DUF853 family protein, partial [Deltaproteobacteria bacterium]|nr:DUF853 family protein [Deltaproteobacteria bacterium]